MHTKLTDIIGLDNGNGQVKGVNGAGKTAAFPAYATPVVGADSEIPQPQPGFYLDGQKAYRVGEEAVLHGRPTARSTDSSYIVPLL